MSHVKNTIMYSVSSLAYYFVYTSIKDDDSEVHVIKNNNNHMKESA